MQEFIDKINNYFRNDGVILARSITIIIIGYMLIKIVIGILKRQVNKSKIEKTVPNFLISILNALLIIVLVIWALSLCGISTDSVVTIASVFTLGISLALQDIIAGLANGLIIVGTKPFTEGEYVSIGGSVEGTVVSISMFHTVLKTGDGLMITVPNTQCTANYVKNFSRMPTRRIEIPVTVGYSSNMEHVKATLFKVVENIPEILKDPAPFCRLAEYGDSNLVYKLRVWTTNEAYWDVYFELYEQILNALNSENIPIDYIQYDLHFKDMPQDFYNKKEGK